MSIDLNKMTVEQVGELRRECEKHLEIWFAFSQEGKSGRAPEFEAATSWRLDGQVEPCCECLEDYPRAELHFHGHIYCKKCRDERGKQ